MGKLVNVVYPEAPDRSYAVDEADVPQILSNNPGAHLEGEGEAAARTTEAYKEQRYGGPWGKVAAGVLAVPRGMTFGGSDVLLGALTGESGREDLRELQERQAGASFAGEAIGALAGGNVPGLNIAGRVGARVGRVAEGAGTLERLGKAAAGAATEGGIYGAGTGISKVGMSENPADIEQAASTITSNMLMGAGIGGAAGTLGKATEIMLGKAKSGLAALKATRAAKSVESREAASVAIADDLAKYRQSVREVNPFVIAPAEESAMLSRTNKQIGQALNTPKSLHEKGLGTMLETQETAYKKLLADKGAVMAEFESANNKIVEQLKQKIAEAPIEAATKIELSGKALDRYKQIADVRVARKIKALEVPREAVADLIGKIESGAVTGQSQKSFEGIQGLLDANQALQQQVKGLASGRAAIGPHPFEDIAHGTMLSAGTALLSPILGPAAPFAANKLARAGTDLVFRRLGNAGAAVGERAGKAVDAFLSLTKAAQKPAPVLATKVLNAVRFGPANDNEDEKGKSLADAFKRRSQELRSQTMYMADGKAALRPEARARLGDQLAGVRAADPMLADKLETVAARKVEYLANKIPRRPDIGGMQLGPDKWQPSDMAMREYARVVHALEDPAGVVERMAAGTITPEEASAIREVFPEMFSRIKMGMISALPQLRKQLPYDRRVALSIFTGVPIDPAMDPKILGVLQGQFAEEQGSEEGTQAPPAAPQFGSISKPEPTAAQERAS